MSGGPKAKLNTGYEIPLVGFGTYKVTGQETVDIAVDGALKAGYRHFDTAKYYVNEPELGISLEKFLPKYNLKREDIFITTKIWPDAENNLEKVPKQIDESLKNLKTSYLDLVLIHYPKANEHENDSPVNAQTRKDCWLALEKIHKSGTIRSIGISNYEVSHMEEIPKYSQTVPAVNQLEYHPHFRRDDIKEYCKKNGILFQAFSSLGRYHADLIGDPVVVELAKKYNTNVEVRFYVPIIFQRILLSFALSQGVGIVPKSTNPDRIAENFRAIELTLTPDEIQRLNSIPKDGHYIRCTGWLVK